MVVNYTVDGFAEKFSSLIKTHETATVFTDFLNYVMSQFSDVSFFDRTRYTDAELKVFYELMEYWILLSEQEISKHGWYDFFGEFYEAYILAKFKAGDKGQFFTSPAVSDLLSKITLQKEDEDNPTLFDAACGSGRNLLAAYIQNKGGFCVGADLDEQACKMCVCNFLLHGITGEVIHMDSLTNEKYGGWIIGYFNSPHVPSVKKINCIQ